MPLVSSSIITSTQHMSRDERIAMSNEDKLAFALYLFGKPLSAGYGASEYYDFIIDDVHVNNQGVPQIKFWWKTTDGYSRDWVHTNNWNEIGEFEMWEADGASNPQP